MSATRVMKFGGAALKDADAMRHVARIVKDASRKDPRVVVASAMQGVTDRLLAALDHGPLAESEVHVLLGDLRERHTKTLEAIAPDGDEAARYALETTLERLERLLFGIAYTEEITPRLQDLVQTFGERLSIPLLAAALRQEGVDGVALDAEHAGVRSLGPFGNARPDIDGLRDAALGHLVPLVAEGKVPVVTGYYGIDADGQATLFGRGGSDYVAALLGVALEAEAVELWKDVAGFMTTDPDAVPKATLVPELSYDEAAELAQFGAKVLHPRAVEPVEPVGIPIQIRCVQAPDDPGSIIRATVDSAPTMVRSVACKDHLAIVRLHGPGMAYTPGVAKRVFDILAGEEINVLNMATSQASFAILLEGAEADRAQAALSGLVGGVIQSIQVMQDRSLVCVVGHGLGETPGSAARILDAVGKKGVNVEMISLGASDIAIDFIVKGGQRADALRGIHAAFLETVVAR